ncbi:alpha/beta hydrolase [Alkalicoccobacillus porphyridii]|uniref:Alpha/beta fold hydrolase n=1 Tax=Alkalicoccobacillus porphyridii TaxID=2597270 RepID=A0A554A3J7_9BACI|nr:alpha/beta fold hydrolase [Alkalicoccobacillus porphyridii]TSB48263.1 alpha/beta fold hydrolase [Alkalicoccobacillus porphyridii]
MKGCLCIHGFTGEPWEVEPIAESLRKQKDWLVYAPTLPGHGPNGDLRQVTYQEWLYMVEVATEELLNRCDEVYVIGFSMGGLLACYIAAKYPIKKLVLLNAAAYYLNPSMLMDSIKEMVHTQITGESSPDQMVDLYRYKVIHTPMHALRQFMTAVKKIRPYIRHVTTPVLIIQGERDALVPRRSSEFLFKNIAAEEKHIYYLKDGRHMICHGFEQSQLLGYIHDFFMEAQDREDVLDEVSST